MQDMLNRLETKVNKIVDVNNLKKPSGEGDDGHRSCYPGPQGLDYSRNSDLFPRWCRRTLSVR